MRALVTGGAGLLGAELVRRAPDAVDVEVTIHRAPLPADLVGVRAHHVDLRLADDVADLVAGVRPDVVVHTAYSRTDHAATVCVAESVAAACAAAAVALVHVSTDALFDGEHPPYSEDDDPSPVHDYGRAKAAAEVAVRAAVPDVAVVRTSLILAPDGSDSTSAWAVDRLRAGERITCFEDEVRCPILVEDLARQIWEVVARPPAERAGAWHLVGPERLSRFEIGRRLAERLGLDPQLVDAAPSPTTGEPRPRDVTLTSRRAASLTWQARPIGSVAAHGDGIG